MAKPFQFSLLHVMVFSVLVALVVTDLKLANWLLGDYNGIGGPPREILLLFIAVVVAAATVVVCGVLWELTCWIVGEIRGTNEPTKEEGEESES